MTKSSSIYGFRFLWLLFFGWSLSSCHALAQNNDHRHQNTMISSHHIKTIAQGGVAVIPNWISSDLVHRMYQDAQVLQQSGYFVPDGLTNTALSEQGFTKNADRQTYRGGGAGWFDETAGDYRTRKEFDQIMTELRYLLGQALHRPTLMMNDDHHHNDDTTSLTTSVHEMTYNWYEPGARLGRHLDEHHEETKGVKGWIHPTRRSVTWLLYLNDAWQATEGGALRTFPRRISDGDGSSNERIPVGAHDGNLQVAWWNYTHPVFLDALRPSGQCGMYYINPQKHGERDYISVCDFDVPRQPIEFEKFLIPSYRQAFEQISTARLDPRFVSLQQHPSSSASSSVDTSTADSTTDTTTARTHDLDEYYIDILPTAGTLVLFDSVTLPHSVNPVTGQRPRIAATGWFHEQCQSLPQFPYSD